ncbi:hypothetical protein D3C81_739800 [compost metagenome]
MKDALGRGQVFQQRQALLRLEQAAVQFQPCTTDGVKDFQALGGCPQDRPAGMRGIESATLGHEQTMGQGQDILLAGALQRQRVGIGAETLE